jgi:hypothetical protein
MGKSDRQRANVLLGPATFQPTNKDVPVRNPEFIAKRDTRSNFDKLCDQLDAAERASNQRRAVMVKRKPSQADLTKSLAVAIDSGAINSADACRVDLLIRQNRVPANLQRALIELNA